MFACEQAGITPDFLCLSKALTGGYLPMAAVLTTDRVYQAFYDDYETLRAFLHSHTYTGNPLACAAALATLDIFEQDNVIEANKRLAARMAQATAHLADHRHVAEVRQTVMALAIEMVQDQIMQTFEAAGGEAALQRLKERMPQPKKTRAEKLKEKRNELLQLLPDEERAEIVEV